jgi:glycosyltransferase involved in cell wall biosynthesis
MHVRYGFVSSYPPTRSGPAAFASSLIAALAGDGPDAVSVIRVVVDPSRTLNGLPGAPRVAVAGELVAGDRQSMRRAAELLNDCDIAIVQHDHDLYGGPDGEEILALLDAVRVPRIVVLHALRVTPTWRERWVLEAVLARAEAVVTMTGTARTRLVSDYDVDERKIHVIPDGVPDFAWESPWESPRESQPPVLDGVSHRPTVLTWGLLAPWKGIEYGITAMAALTDLEPAPRYLIAGPTHPSLFADDGEDYRGRLAEQVRQLGLDGSVTFDGRYRDTASMLRLVRSADVVLLPYDPTDKVSSSVLTGSVAALTPVVATRFPHAIELLAGGAGALVGHRDPAEIAAALRTVLTRPEVAAGMVRAAVERAPVLTWSAVAGRYRKLAGLVMPNVIG